MAFAVTLLWEREFPFSFNSVVIEPTNTGHKFLVGCGDGKIRVIKNVNVCNTRLTPHTGLGWLNTLDTSMIQQEEDILETKGGAIQQILLHDFTRFGESDIISADADGNVVLFSNLRILYRASVGHPISCLSITSDLRGYTTLVTGDRAGVVTGLQLHHGATPLWRAQVSATDHIYKPLLVSHDSPDLSIRCLLSVNLPPLNTGKGLAPGDRLSHYLLVAASTPHLHFYTEGKRVYTLVLPSLINSMCEGVFTGEHENKSEVALGCENGFVYILRDFAIHKLIQVGHTITQLHSLNSAGGLNSNSTNGTTNHTNHSNGYYDNMALDGISHSQSLSQKLSVLLCVGHFNALRMYSKSLLVKEIPTQDWVHTLAVIGDTEEATLAAGLANNNIQVYKLYQNT